MTAMPAGPYPVEVPRNDRPAGGFRTVVEQLDDALGNLDHRLAAEVASRLAPNLTRGLARLIVEATDKAVRDHAEDHAAGVLAQTAELARQRIAEQAPAEPIYRCAEDGCEWHSGDLAPIEAQYAHVDHLAEHDTDNGPESQCRCSIPDDPDCPVHGREAEARYFELLNENERAGNGE